MSPEDIVPVRRPGITGWIARRQIRTTGTVHSSCCMVAWRASRAKRHHCEAPSICCVGLVSFARRIAGRRRENFIACDYRSRRPTGSLSRILERNRHGAVRHCCGSGSWTGGRRVYPDSPSRSIRTSITCTLGSNCSARGWKLDSGKRSVDAWLGSSNTLAFRGSAAFSVVSYTYLTATVGGVKLGFVTVKTTAWHTQEQQEIPRYAMTPR